MKPAKQRQWFAAPDSKLKITRKDFADGKSSIVTLAGYPIVWNDTSSDRGGYKVRLAKNSATFTQPAMALWHHDFSKPLASTANGSLRIGQADDYGVPVEIDLDTNTSAGADAAAYVTSGLVKGMSFSMANGFEDYNESSEGGQKILNATKYTVDEVTITAIPAFAAATIAPKPEDNEEEGAAGGEAPAAGGMSDKPAPNRITASHRLASLRLAVLKSEI